MRAVKATTDGRELSARALITGFLLGGTLSLCNIYSGLKMGWGFNMSITAALLGYGMWRGAEAAGAAPFTKLENNINQTAASAGASISSAGLVSAIPALTLLTGYQFSWPTLALWTFLIGLTGVVVGVGLRRQLIEVDRLPFPSGVAAAETLERMYASGSEAMRKLLALLFAGVITGAWKLVCHFAHITNVAIPGSFAAGARRATLANVTFALDPSPLMVAVGAMGSLRTGVSMMAGAGFAWLVLAPMALQNGWCEAGGEAADASWYGPVVRWLLWPGVGMMVAASLTSIAFSWRTIVRTFTGGRVDEKPAASASASDAAPRDAAASDAAPRDAAASDAPRDAAASDAPSDAAASDAPSDAAAPVAAPALTDTVPLPIYRVIVGVVIVVVAIGQVLLFDIAWWAALLAVVLTFVLASVAGRVSGETNITPVGAMGKVTQLVFGAAVPANVTANLMSANVTGGAASQCADLLHDFKTGSLVGASPRRQSIAQVVGVLGGAIIGSLAYLVLIPHPETQIGTDEWPAPAVATWRAVAELFAQGFDAMPPYALHAMGIGAAAGVVLTILEKTLPATVRDYVPSPNAFGLAFVVQAWYAISLFVGSLIGLGARRYSKSWSDLYLIPICAGVIAGESLTGVGLAAYAIITGDTGGGH